MMSSCLLGKIFGPSYIEPIMKDTLEDSMFPKLKYIYVLKWKYYDWHYGQFLERFHARGQSDPHSFDEVGADSQDWPQASNLYGMKRMTRTLMSLTSRRNLTKKASLMKTTRTIGSRQKARIRGCMVRSARIHAVHANPTWMILKNVTGTANHPSCQK
jgi:hypothetical protein